MHGRTRRIRRTSVALSVLLVAGLTTAVPGVATAAGWPTYISVGRYPSTVVISRDGSRAYVTETDGRNVVVIDTAAKTVIGAIGVAGEPHDIALSPDNRTAYTTNSGFDHFHHSSVSVVDVVNRRSIGQISVAPLRYPEAVAVTPDGSKAYVVGHGQDFAVINTATGVARTIYVGNTGGTDIEITPDGSRAYVADSYNRNIMVLSTATDSVIATLPLDAAPSDIAIMPDGRRAYVTSHRGKKIYMIATAGLYVGATVDLPESPTDVAAAPDGRKVHVSGYDGTTLTTIDVATNAISQSRPINRYPASVAIPPNGTEAYVANSSDGYVAVHDITAEPGPDRLVGGERLTAGQSRTSTDGRFRLVMQADGNLVLYSASGEALWHTGTYGSGATHAVLQHDGNFVVYTAAGEARWSTRTWTTPADRLVVQNDSNLVLYGPGGKPYWHRMQ